MIRKCSQILIFILIFIFPSIIYPQVISGKISGTENKLLPFTNIFCPELNIGTTSNLDGEFVFKLIPGQRKIIFSYVGYKSDTLLIDLKPDEKYEVSIVLKERSAEMPTIYVLDSGLSEAERIILRTIAGKNDYLERIKNYEYTAYDKTVISAQVKDTVMIGGIMESFTKAYFQQPDKFNETIISKRQTKNMASVYTNFFTSGKLSNLLDEEIRIDEVYIISPLNINALDYYSFQVEDTTYYNNRHVFIINFEPKNSVIPLFTGRIGIINNLFIPLFFKLSGGTSVLTAARKEIEIEEKFSEFNDELWMPILVNEKYTFNFSIPGFPPIYGNHTCLLSEYKINDPDFKYEFTKNIQMEKLVPDSESVKLWENNQQILLTQKEKNAVVKIDSVMDNIDLSPKK